MAGSYFIKIHAKVAAKILFVSLLGVLVWKIEHCPKNAIL